MLDHRRTPIEFLAMVAVALLSFAIPVQAQVAHGAIAFGHSGKAREAAYGFAWNHATRDEAEASALDACVEGGGADCALLA